MTTMNIIRQISYPIKKSNIFPCSKKVCLCIEYLDFKKLDHVNLYKHCMITDYNNSKGPPPRILLRKKIDIPYGSP